MFRLLLCLLPVGLLVFTSGAHGAIDIRFDYRYDTQEFLFGNAERKAVLEAAAAVFESRLTAEVFAALSPPSSSDNWELNATHPGGGGSVTFPRPSIPEGVITIYVGGRGLAPSLLSESSPMTLVPSQGSVAWLRSVSGRNSTTNYDSLGGTIPFNDDAPWYFDTDPETMEAFPEQYDFFSMAQREIGSLLGFNLQSKAFSTEAADGTFGGQTVVNLYGRSVPLSGDGTRWANGFTFDGDRSVMTADLALGERASFNDLDFAVLADLGYKITPAPVPEPGLWSLTAGGLGLLAARRRRTGR